MADLTKNRILEILQAELAKAESSVTLELARQIYDLQETVQFTEERDAVNRRIMMLLQAEIERRVQ